MPHLQYEFDHALAADTRRALIAWTTEQYSEIMETGTGHVAVTVRELDATALSLGRAPADEPVAVLNADVRAGRSAAQRQSFASAVIDYLDGELGVPADHCYVVYTEHDGPDFVLNEGPLASWSDAEAEHGPTE
jgi:phenylpyruvate tautomerase PptA (4-oxalocrotonate tautomerase family)